MIPYVWIKAAHVSCVLVFVAGLVLQSFALAAASQGERRIVVAIRRWDRLVTVPSMLGVWGFGIVLATEGAWFTSRWLQFKLVLVVGLTAWHGMQSGRFRRVSAHGTRFRPQYNVLIAIAAVVATAILVTVKPFS